jgi:hypothetical protein
VVAAIEDPQAHAPVREDDWRLLFAAMVARGYPASFVASVAAGDSNDPDLCPALAAMFRASADLVVPAAGSIRVDLARNLTGY